MNDFIKPTGDPFIDVGGFVIEQLNEKFPKNNILQQITYVTDIYVKHWGGKLHTYFLNSSITQPAFNTEKKIDETLKYYRGLIEETNQDYKVGYCRITGTETKLYPAGRHNHMMSASSAFINFHSAYESGLYLSKEALIRTFFVPLGVCFVGDKIAVLQSNYDIVNRFLVRKNVDENLRNISNGLAEGTLKSEFGIISNALFNFADYCISSLPIAISEDEKNIALWNVQLNLYHFTNFGASPDIELYTFSNLLFLFYGYCKKNHAKEWSDFINQHYKSSKFKEAQFDENTQEWYNKKERLQYGDYKTWNNPILNKLIKNSPILSNLRQWSKKHQFSFNIVQIYCINILKMDKYTIQKIKELAEFILDDKSEDQITKSLVKLNGLKGVGDFRLYLIKLIKDNYEDKNPAPLVTLEDYIFYLFPDGTYWKEMRDLLIIAIYQNLHETNRYVSVEDVPENEEEK